MPGTPWATNDRYWLRTLATEAVCAEVPCERGDSAVSTPFPTRGGGRAHYGGGHHTSSHGGHYTGGHGSSHKGGQYHNSKTGNRYGTHK
jgi:hypothetical protein